MVLIVMLFITADVSAGCESTYGGGETCIYNKRFSIEKKVIQLDDDDDWDDWEDIAKDSDDWEDKVTGVAEDEFVVFKIVVENLSDEELDEFDDMKMIDDLPDELEKIGGSGLTEYWDDFEPGEKKTFYIAAEVNEDEYDRDEDFSDCAVNTASVEWDGEFEGEDTAKVCYDEEIDEVEELPSTGSNEVVVALGFSLIVAGLVIKRRLA